MISPVLWLPVVLRGGFLQYGHLGGKLRTLPTYRIQESNLSSQRQLLYRQSSIPVQDPASQC